MEELRLDGRDLSDVSAGCSWFHDGGVSVCEVWWRRCKISDVSEFCSVLSRSVPEGTRFFGRKRQNDDGSCFYVVLIGFPFRVGCWTGIEERLRLTCSDGVLDDCVPEVEVPSDFLEEYLKNEHGVADAFVGGCVRWIVIESDGELFGTFSCFVSGGLRVLAPLVMSVGEMWNGLRARSE